MKWVFLGLSRLAKPQLPGARMKWKVGLSLDRGSNRPSFRRRAVLLKRVVALSILALLGIYLAKNYLDKRAEDAAKEVAATAERERTYRATANAVAMLVARTRAITDWEKILSKGQEFREAPILTVELEHLWVQRDPILFLGSITDIKTRTQQEYIVDFEKSLFGSFRRLFESTLRLSLSCDKKLVDSILLGHPKLFDKPGSTNEVAVVAKIESIRNESVNNAEGEIKDVKVGEGQCIDMVYTGGSFQGM
jgi:hypothetical protein